ICGTGLVVGALVIRDRLFEIVDAFLRTFEEPTGASHVRVGAAEHIRGWPITDELQSLFKVFEPRFVISFVNIGHAHAEIRFSKTAPVAILTKTLERSLRKVARNRILSDRPV